ncbi:protein yiej [Paenibacillus terrae HPL-003]|uniref:Protein yiej n=1 Tax=Paenibacillus terrae (strain HPL-003) TaxID=985665 RepID=G7VRB5_PAETH|nr:protein yiej [Paenibacillus terrae HPL-003]
MLQGTFHYPACCAQLEEAKLDELLHRTPGYEVWQTVAWLDHCDDYCIFIDFVGWKELVSRGIENDVNLMFMPILVCIMKKRQRTEYEKAWNVTDRSEVIYFNADIARSTSYMRTTTELKWISRGE